LKKSRKIYFYDNGIRNAIINNFNPLTLRNDVGALWENYLISERMKSRSHANIKANHYFWRTHAQQEIDYLEEYDGQLRAWEFKWKSSGRARIPKTFIDNYPQAITDIITPDNYLNFLNNIIND
jgi:predicted AAA+ superfamily ATPase